MLRTRGRKIIRDIWSRKGRTLLVSTSIFIGVLAVVTLFTVRTLIIRQLHEDIREDKLTMIDIFVSASSDGVIDNAAYLAALNRQKGTGEAPRALDGIELAEGLAYYPITFREPGSDTFVEAELRTYATLLQDVQLEPMRLLEDSAWPTLGQRQVALEKRMANHYGFGVGDEIVFRAVSPAGTREETFTVSGLVFHPYSYQRSTATGGMGFGPEDGIYAQYEDARFLLNFAGLSAFVARYETFELAERRVEALQDAIAETTPYVPFHTHLDNPTNAEQLRNAETIINVLGMLAIVTMVVSGFLVVNMINTIMVEQKRQVGVMKSLGASRQDTFLIYTGTALVYGILGTFPALVAGVFLGYQLALFVAPMADVLLEGFTWSPSSVLVGALLGLFVPVLAAIVPVYRGIQVGIIEAMMDLGIASSYGHGWLARRIGALPLPISVRQAISNVFQKRGRLILTTTTLTLAIGAFMGVIAAGLLFTNEIRNVFDRLGYQILVVPSELQEINEVMDVIKGVEGVKAVAPGALVSVQIEGGYVNPFSQNSQVMATALDPAADVFHFSFTDGDGWSQDPTRDGVVITSTMASQLGLEAGDDITFVVRGNRAKREVIGVDAAIFDSLYVEWTELASLAGLVRGAPQPNQYAVEAQLGGHARPVMAVGVGEPARTLLSPNGWDRQNVLVTRSLADAAGLVVGESLNVSIGEHTGRHQLAGVVQLPAHVESPAQEAILFAFDDLVGITGVSLQGEPTPNGYFVTMEANNPTTQEVDDVMARVKQTLLERGKTAEFQNQIEQAELMTDMIMQFVTILLIAAALIAAVGAVGLLTTLAISVFERQKEIGVMRSIGAGSATIATQFLVEGIVVSVIAWVLAVPLSYVIAVGLIAAFQMDSIKFSYPVSTLLIGLAGTLGLATLASLTPALIAVRKTVSDILRYQ